MDDPVLSARDLSKWYGPFQALRSVSFDLRRGEIVGFLGPNGAGKSTTMKVLTGYVAPSSGTATIAGHDLAEDPLGCRAAVGYLPEELPLYLDMRVDSYLDHVARLKGVPASRRRAEVVEAIEAARLTENARRHIRKLSKGNRQRVGVAQALLGKPPILILDEPTSGLDPSQVAHFRELLRRLADRHAILLSTHILAEVEAACTRAVIVHRGRTIADEPISALRARAARGRLRLRVRSGDAAPLREALAVAGFAVAAAEADSLSIEGAEERRAELAAAAESHGGLRELVEERLSLEEVFRDLIAEGESNVPDAAAASRP